MIFVGKDYVIFPTGKSRIWNLTHVSLVLIRHRRRSPDFSSVSDRKDDVILTYTYQEYSTYGLVHIRCTTAVPKIHSLRLLGIFFHLKVVHLIVSSSNLTISNEGGSSWILYRLYSPVHRQNHYLSPVCSIWFVMHVSHALRDYSSKIKKALKFWAPVSSLAYCNSARFSQAWSR